jgi:hypothetical protein
VAEIIGENFQKIVEKIRNARIGAGVNVGAQEFEEGNFWAWRNFLENANMLWHGMQPNAFWFGKVLLLQKVGVTHM